MSILDKANKGTTININDYIDRSTILISIENAHTVYGCVKLPEIWQHHNGSASAGIRKGFVIAKLYEVIDTENLTWLLNPEKAAEIIVNAAKIKGKKNGKKLYYNASLGEKKKWENNTIVPTGEYFYTVIISSKPNQRRSEAKGFKLSFTTTSRVALPVVENMEVKSFNVF